MHEKYLCTSGLPHGHLPAALVRLGVSAARNHDLACWVRSAWVLAGARLCGCHVRAVGQSGAALRRWRSQPRPDQARLPARPRAGRAMLMPKRAHAVCAQDSQKLPCGAGAASLFLIRHGCVRARLLAGGASCLLGRGHIVGSRALVNGATCGHPKVGRLGISMTRQRTCQAVPGSCCPGHPQHHRAHTPRTAKHLHCYICCLVLLVA